MHVSIGFELGPFINYTIGLYQHFVRELLFLKILDRDGFMEFTELVRNDFKVRYWRMSLFVFR